MTQSDPLLYQLLSKKIHPDVMASFVATLIHFYLTPSLAQVIELMDTLLRNILGAALLGHC